MDSHGYVWDGADLILRVRVQPRSSRDHWSGLQDGRFGVRITAPPVDGQANAHLREWLAGLCGVAKSRVTLLSGETGREKRFRVAAPKRLPPGVEAAAKV
ncbi:MAG: YggU family protein [Candidatus Competibacteraceae bacterium]|nr:MAG: YggU family protein [Candidatus Competibacteraceae bacterium]